MIFRQLLDRPSGSYTYLVARRSGGEAMLVDPLPEHMGTYLALLAELDVRLRYAVVTHTHGPQPALAELAARTGCETVAGEPCPDASVARRVADGEWLDLDRMLVQALATPGHTPDSFSFAMNDLCFTGDTLLIRSTGRTDLEGGDALAQYRSLFDVLLWLPDQVLVYPAHDYKGWTCSSIAEEKAYNPRLRIASAERYAELMGGLAIADPALMDLAAPAGPPFGPAPG
ncbi:MAG: MBL fold metallo-hydrolase [Deltaproteobacteria bacterium]|nr:MBL fold metallo-hydrolase [Deltaproteobacteria bacterium]